MLLYLEKGFPKKQQLRLHSTVFIIDYMTKPVWSHACFALECLDFEESSYSQLPGSLRPDYICMQKKLLTK